MNAFDRLVELGEAAFAEAGASRSLLALWRPRFERAARWFLSYETQRRQIIERSAVEVQGSLGDLAPSNDHFALGLPAYAVDIAKAKALLDEIGLKDTNGDGMRELPDGSAFTPELQTSSSFSAQTAEAVKEYLRTVGINIKSRAWTARPPTPARPTAPTR